MTSFYEQVENGILAWEVDLGRFTASEIRRIRGILTELRDDIIAQLRRIAPQDAVRIETRLRRLTRLLESVDATIDSTYDVIRGTNLDFNQQVARFGRTAVGATINTALEVPLFDVVINDRLMREIVNNTIIDNETTGQWWRSHSRDYIQAINRELRTGILQGETIGQLTTRVRNVADTSYNWARSLARTSSITVNNNSVLGTYQDNEDIVRGVQWLSTLDSRTTLICRGLSDKRWRFPDNGDASQFSRYRAVGHNKRFPGPTAHWQCLYEDQFVFSPSLISKVFKRLYKGDIIKISIKNGNEIIVTPNHPIASSLGWKPANVLQVGHSIVRAENWNRLAQHAVLPVYLFDYSYTSVVHEGSFHGDINKDYEVHIGHPCKKPTNEVIFKGVLDKIVDIAKTFYDGYVYNFNTENNWYLVDGVVAHNCRSTQIPWMRPLGGLSGEIRQDLSDTSRAAFERPVPIGTTQEQWLRRLSRAEQIEILGQTRYNLFRQGLDLDDLTNQYNRPLTIAELERKYNV